ncbi:unnamed protein product [Chrysodeixis includens]|uniref:Uncharacterized protein n=1 Tax=Chrysodeixis includens TaxID=689277 RepID=A0A9P0BZU4_CHRIL|nr:unnamed protein product [Chrysodeixis includens]
MPLNHKHGLDKTEVELSESLPIKGHRRSISGLKNDDDKPAFVILKILDNSGDSKIEIKLGPDNSAKRRKNRDNKSKNKSKFSMSLQSNTNDQIKKRVLARNTIISVMPNNSIVIDEYERIITDGKKKTKEIMKIDENITNDMKAKITIPHVNNKIIRNVTDYEDVLFTKANGKGTGTAEMFVNKDVYTNTLFNNNKPDFGTVQNIVNNVTYSIGVTETKPSFTPKIDEVNSTSSVVTTTEKQEYLIIPTLLMLQGEHLSNNDISNTFLFDDFVLAQNSTEKFRPVTNVSMIDEHFTDLVTPVTVQDINLMADVNVPTDGSPSSVTNVPNANVESFDLLSKLDALSENSTLTSIESISQDDNIHVRTEHAIKEETSTILTTNLTLHDELRSDTITNVAIQNDHYVILATTQNEDVVPANAAVNSTVANENANVENNTKNNLV